MDSQRATHRKDATPGIGWGIKISDKIREVDPKKIGEAIDKLIKHAHCPKSKRFCMGGRYDTCFKCWAGYLAKEVLKTLPKADLPFQSSNVFLDFEKIKESYDAIELLTSKDRGLYYKLYGWDCDCILVLNKDVIKEVTPCG